MRSLVRRLTLLDSAVYSICTSVPCYLWKVNAVRLCCIQYMYEWSSHGLCYPSQCGYRLPSVCVWLSFSRILLDWLCSVKTLSRLTPQCPTHCGARIKYVILCIQVIFKKILSKYVYSVFIWLKFALNMRSIVSRRRLMLLDSCIPYVWVFHVTYRRLSCNFLFRRVS